jgi:Na+-translocating ferredoxin:NAD+ oxidoreductase RNF subunit RnfB
MNARNTYDRLLEIQSDICIGCSHCLKVCPTEAMRVRGGKAVIYADWCVDCGECFRVCPTRAIRVADDDFKQIFDYKYRVLLVPSMFYAQFGEEVPRDTVTGIIGELGFDEVCAVEQSVDSLVDEVDAYVAQADEKPVISTYCPAVTRLIQVRFPALVDHLMLLMPPIEITAQYYRRRCAELGVEEHELGIFYLTPCIAKIAAVKTPLGGYRSPVTGAINMDFFYNKVYLAYRQRMPVTRQIRVNAAVSAKGILYPTTGGEAANVKGRTLAIDGVDNVIDFLEQLENGEIAGIDFLELRTCDESCAGGILSLRNRFLAADSMRRESRRMPDTHSLVDDYRECCRAMVHMEPIEPRSMVKYDRNIDEALRKMERARRLKDMLPDIDCGACGAPSCEALAEDVVREGADINSCLFLRTAWEKRGELTMEDANTIMERIWGKDRFDTQNEEG